ncbi:MAG: hypothetical protein ABSC53_13400 [Bacteroidota bacterium]
MNKPKPTNKPLIKRGRKTKVEMIFEETIEEQTMSFNEFVRRIVRVNPQEIKLPKR